VFLVWPTLIVPDIDLVEDIVLESRIVSRVKTQDLRSGEDNACTLFPS
jgi:hypothetical protein